MQRNHVGGQRDKHLNYYEHFSGHNVWRGLDTNETQCFCKSETIDVTDVYINYETFGLSFFAHATILGRKKSMDNFYNIRFEPTLFFPLNKFAQNLML